MKLVIPIVASAAVLAGLATGAAHRAPAAPHHGPGFHLERMIEHLDLTAAQQEAIRPILEAHRAAMAKGREQDAAAHEALHKAILAEPLDERAVEEAAATVAAVLTERALAHAKLVSEIRPHLTPEQRETMTALHAARSRRGFHHGGH